MARAWSGVGLTVCGSVLFVLGLCGLLVLPAVASSSLVWEGDAYSSGVEVSSSPLNYGVLYRIVAAEVWFYKGLGDNLAADAMYYTTDYLNSVFWGNHFALPNGHSFLQINRQDENWGPFSNGDSGNHTYTIYYTGTGAALAFRIVDWNDSSYTENFCHIHIKIFRDVTVGGSIADLAPDGVIVSFVVGAVVFAAVSMVPVVSRRKRVCG